MPVSDANLAKGEIDWALRNLVGHIMQECGIRGMTPTNGELQNRLVALVQGRETAAEARGRAEERAAWQAEGRRVESEITEFDRPITPDHDHHEIRDWLTEAFQRGRETAEKEIVAWLREHRNTVTAYALVRIEAGAHRPKGER